MSSPRKDIRLKTLLGLVAIGLLLLVVLLFKTAPPIQYWTYNDVLDVFKVLVPVLAVVGAVVSFQIFRSDDSNRIYAELLDNRLSRPNSFVAAEGATIYVNSSPGSEGDDATAEGIGEALRIETLWADAQDRLVSYHKLADRESKLSFTMLMVVSGVGFLILIVLAWQSTRATTTAGSVTVGTMGVLGAALATYIGRTFQRTYRETAERLVDYFEQPLQLTRLLAAERLLRRLDGAAADEAILKIIDAALSRDEKRSRSSRIDQNSEDGET